MEVNSDALDRLVAAYLASQAEGVSKAGPWRADHSFSPLAPPWLS